MNINMDKKIFITLDEKEAMELLHQLQTPKVIQNLRDNYEMASDICDPEEDKELLDKYRWPIDFNLALREVLHKFILLKKENDNG